VALQPANKAAAARTVSFRFTMISSKQGLNQGHLLIISR
jgi:hypothetical protein